MPFREAHVAVGALVRRSHEDQVPLADLVAHDARLAEAAPLLDPGRGASRRTTPGGAGPEPVRAQLDAAARRLDDERAWLAG